MLKFHETSMVFLFCSRNNVFFLNSSKTVKFTLNKYKITIKEHETLVLLNYSKTKLKYKNRCDNGKYYAFVFSKRSYIFSTNMGVIGKLTSSADEHY